MSYKSPTGVKIIGGLKLLTAALLIAGGAGAFHFMNHDFLQAAKHFLVLMHLDPKNSFLNGIITSVTDLDHNDLRKIGIATFIYASLYIIEGVGLLKTKRWAEYMTIIITASLLPFEIYEVFLKVTWLRVSALVINTVIVVYLWRILKRNVNG